MTWLLSILAILLVSVLIGFFGLAALATVAGQYFLVMLIGAIATYWVAVSLHNRIAWRHRGQLATA